ncbi:MAG: TauD/TfdA family dioxygenase [Kiloniellales bacterium]
MTEICRTHLEHPGAWRGSDFASKDDFSFDLEGRHLKAIERAMDRIRKQGLGLDDIEREHFQLEEIAEDIAGYYNELRDGRGFFMLRGFPLDRYTQDEIGMIYWGLGTHLGVGVSQSVLGDRLGHVKDFSQNDPNARAYRNNKELDLHTDLSDIVSLLSLAKAAEGGSSQFVSALTVHNEILAQHPEYLEPLYRGFRYHRAGEEAPGEEPVTPWNVPVFAYLEGRLSTRYVRAYLERGHAILDQPLTELELAALDYLDTVAQREKLEVVIEPGEAVFQNNYTVFHARSGFTDDPAKGQVRHLLRLWLDVPENGYPAVKEMRTHAGAGIARQEGRMPSGEGDAYKEIIRARKAASTSSDVRPLR